MSITAKELARILNVSQAAVSIALNNKAGISTSTRKRIIQAAEEYGYDFSRKISSGRAFKGQICFVIYKKCGAVVADTPFFSELTNSISISCKKAHYDMIIRYLYEDEFLGEQIVQLKSSDFAGMILLATEMDQSSLKAFSEIKVPILILDSYFEASDYDCVLINNIKGAYQATSHLISKRKTQPGYLRSSYSIGNFEERADGFYKAIRANGMSTSKSIVHRLSPSQEGAYADMQAMIEYGEPLADCYFADNDHIAIGAIKAFTQAGIRVPEDIAVVGFDDLPECAYMSPPLTTINVPVTTMGEKAVERLVEMVERKDDVPLKIEISTSLKKRRSV